MAALLPAQAAETVSLTIDPIVMLFAAALAIGTGVLFGLFPALHSTRPDLISSLEGTERPAVRRAVGVALPHRRWRRRRSRCRWRCWCRRACSRAACSTSAASISACTPTTSSCFRSRRRCNGYKVEQTRQLFERVEDEIGALPGVTGVTQFDGAAAERQQLGQRRGGRRASRRGPTPTPTRASTKSVRAIFRRSASRCSPGRDFTRADALDRAAGRDRQRGVREEVQPGARRGRQADRQQGAATRR